jgi:hypothetical protein
MTAMGQQRLSSSSINEQSTYQIQNRRLLVMITGFCSQSKTKFRLRDQSMRLLTKQHLIALLSCLCYLCPTLANPMAQAPTSYSNTLSIGPFLAKDQPHRENHNNSNIRKKTPSSLRQRDLTIALDDKWSLYLTTTQAYLPAQQAAPTLVAVYQNLAAWASYRIAANDPTLPRVVVSLGSMALTMAAENLDPQQTKTVPWQSVMAIALHMARLTQRGFGGGYRGALMSVTGSVIYVSLEKIIETSTLGGYIA